MAKFLDENALQTALSYYFKNFELDAIKKMIQLATNKNGEIDRAILNRIKDQLVENGVIDNAIDNLINNIFSDGNFTDSGDDNGSNSKLVTQAQLIKYIKNFIDWQNGVVFKGVLQDKNSFSSVLQNEYKAGWTYKIGNGISNIDSHLVEPGDMIICIKDKDGDGKYQDWTIIQNNVQKPLYIGNNNFVTTNQLVIFDGETGKVASSGIKKSQIATKIDIQNLENNSQGKINNPLFLGTDNKAITDTLVIFDGTNGQVKSSNIDVNNILTINNYTNTINLPQITAYENNNIKAYFSDKGVQQYSAT